MRTARNDAGLCPVGVVFPDEQHVACANRHRRREEKPLVVSLVIVSHCHQLAEGVKELADQIANESVPIVAVGGVLQDNQPPRLGTDALRIMAAIEEVWTAAGVLLLVDLGSAILSTEMALDMLPPEKMDRCLISNAPIVEGAVVAALEASVGRNLQAVNEAAEATCRFAKVERVS